MRQTLSFLLLQPTADKGSWCEQQLCDCDKEVAFCLKRNMGTYNKKLHFARFSKSRCKGQTPMC